MTSGKPVEPDVAAVVNDEDIAPVDTEDGRDELSIKYDGTCWRTASSGVLEPSP
jgi:hypothetical protein